MCLAIPGRVVRLDAESSTAQVSYGGLCKSASTMLLPDVSCGDYVLVHAGFIIQLLSEQDGAELSRLADEAGFYEQ